MKTQKATIDFLIETVALVVEVSGQSKTPAASVCLPDEVCGLCASLGHDPWTLLAVFRKATKPKRKAKR